MNMKVDYMYDAADDAARGTSLYRSERTSSNVPNGKLSYTKRSSNFSPTNTVLNDELGITERSNFIENNSSPVGTGGLAETSIPPVKMDPPGAGKGDPGDGGPGDGGKTLKEEGMSRGMANFQAGAGIGLGLLSFLENRKTSKLQREALRHDIDTAKEHRANRQALGASFSAGLSKGLGGGSK